MKTRRYPFRYYGREPADWIPSPHGYLYDVQFEADVTDDTRAAVRALAERHFARGPAALGQVWSWGAGRFLAFSVIDRITDAPRMVFTQVTEFLSQLHHAAHIEDVVFSNGVGSRSDRWDAWSLEMSPSPDAGPRRPEAPWATVLRRPESPNLTWDEPSSEPDLEVAKAAPPPPARARKASPSPAKPAPASSKPTFELVPVDALPVQREEGVLVERRQQLMQHFAREGAEFTPVKGASVPIVWDGDDAILCFDAEKGRRRIELPGKVPGRLLAVDPDGVRAVTRIGQVVYSIDLMRGSVQRKFSIHVNNGDITGLAWVVDDLWVERCRIQMTLHDFSDEDPLYVGYAQPAGDLVGTIRHGTILVFDNRYQVSFVGVCDWQLMTLGTVNGSSPLLCDDEVFVTSGGSHRRVGGLAEVYEAWAAPLRRLAERNRVKRMLPVKKKPALRWHLRPGEEIPAEKEKLRRDELRAEHGETIWSDVRASGSAVIATALEGKEVTQGARMWFCPPGGRAHELACRDEVGREGITNYSMTPDEKKVFIVAGTTFKVYRVGIDTERVEHCEMPAFMHYPGLLFDIWAPAQGDMLALWGESIDWHHHDGERWTTPQKIKVSGPRNLSVDRSGSGYFALLQQSRDRLKVFQWHDDHLSLVAKFTDAVKRATWREGRLYAQMTDGLWFELGELPPAT